MDICSACDLVTCLGDFNGHIGRHIDGVQGGYGVGQTNMEGRMLLEFCLVKELCVSNTWLKRDGRRNVTFRIGKMRQKLTLC